MLKLSLRTGALRNNLKSQPHPSHAKATTLQNCTFHGQRWSYVGISSERAWLPPPAALLAGLQWEEGWSACDLCHFRHPAVLVKSLSSLLLKMHITTLVFSTQVGIWFLLLQPLTFHEKVTPCMPLSGKAFQPPGKAPTSLKPMPKNICCTL